MIVLKTLMKVINYKPPPHKHELHSPTKYRSHPCQHHMILVNGYMNLVDCGCLDLT